MTKALLRAKRPIQRPVTFDEYRSIAEDLENRLEPRFEVLETKIGALDMKIDSLRHEMRTMMWLIPLLITLIMGVFSVVMSLINK